MSTIAERHTKLHFRLKDEAANMSKPMPDRMTIIEEMREQDRKLDRDVERIMSSTPRCEIHDCHFVAGCGVAGEPTHVFGPGGGCPQCWYEQRRTAAELEHAIEFTRNKLEAEKGSSGFAAQPGLSVEAIALPSIDDEAEWDSRANTR